MTKLKIFIETFNYLARISDDELVSKNDLFIALLNTGKFSAVEAETFFIKAEDNGQIFQCEKGRYNKI